MRLYRYQTAEGPQLGIGVGQLIYHAPALYDLAGQRPPDVVLAADIKSICAAPDSVIVFLADFLNQARSLPEPDGKVAVHAEDATLLPPLPNPGKFICIGLNYQDHCDEQNKPRPDHPILFGKYNNAIVGARDNVIKSPATQKLDFEGELGVVIGSGGKGIKRERALDHVFGYTVINDISARDLQKADVQFLRAKSQDTFAPMGPCIVTSHEIPDPQALSVRTTLNGTVMQDSTTANMIFPVVELIEFISEGITLEPGDIISTGTPAGVGVHRNPPVLMNPGDVVEVEIGTIGKLRNQII
jgi:2-keto-4-pentenoate hydratase/2-oxohepta-3-ene-1,7-dioic acid hydratase in catechol pathway